MPSVRKREVHLFPDFHLQSENESIEVKNADKTINKAEIDNHSKKVGTFFVLSTLLSHSTSIRFLKILF